MCMPGGRGEMERRMRGFEVKGGDSEVCSFEVEKEKENENGGGFLYSSVLN